MTLLSVNLNKIALIRNSREGDYPSVIKHAKTCLTAGADGITVHPRPDQRHIRPHDVRELAELISTCNTPAAPIEYNIEGNPFADAQGDYPGLLALAKETQPDQCTLVPDNSEQLTSDHGFDLTRSGDALQPIITQLHEWNIRVSLFTDPDPMQINLAHAIGADRIELYTGPYAAAEKNRSSNSSNNTSNNKNTNAETADTLFQDYFIAAQHAHDLGLGVNAGHDLNLDNLAKLNTLPGLLEVSIGHALIVDALAMGLEQAVRAYKKLLCQ